MDRRWTSHIVDLDEKKRFEAYIKGSRTVLDRLSEIIVDFELQLEEKEVDSKAYESPAWAFQQADNIGYRRALRQILKIINLDQKERTNG